MLKLYISATNALQDRQRGAAMPEYGLLVALIAVVALTATAAIGTSVTAKFGQIATAIAGG